GFPVDPDFPQLAVASDPGRMLELFRERLTPIAGKECEIETCQPFRFRVRQSTARAVLQYTLHLVDRATGRRWDQWVTGLVYAELGKAEALWRELRASDPRRDIPVQWLVYEPVDFIPELGMLVQLFPFDRKLPHLAPVLNGALQELEPRLARHLGPGDWRRRERTIEPTRYRTELGAALRYTLRAREERTARAGTVRCYLKVYRDHRGAATNALLESLAARPEDARPYTAVRPVAYLAELRTLVLEEAAGTALQELLLERRDSGDALRRVARAVAAFNQDDVAVTEPYSLADQLDEVRRAGALLQWAYPDAGAEIDALVGAVARGLSDVPPAPIHRDLKTDHLFLSPTRVIFIDLDSAGLGDPVRDPAHLFAHIVGRVGLDALSREEARAAARAFAEEYFLHVPPEWRERFAPHCAGALLEVARGIFKRQETGWRDKVRAAIEEARRALTE
ncbi:MAG TPA: hypothetical protein VGQ25_06215, partial [Gemmatimonadales bacterium]|nr:hypothetical protein [Gemmatimonadales bacterium]